MSWRLMAILGVALQISYVLVLTWIKNNVQVLVMLAVMMAWHPASVFLGLRSYL